MDDNLLEDLPPEIGNLSKLETLNASNNKLEKLPYQFYKLIELRKLCLKNNGLKELDRSCNWWLNYVISSGKLYYNLSLLPYIYVLISSKYFLYLGLILQQFAWIATRNGISGTIDFSGYKS